MTITGRDGVTRIGRTVENPGRERNSKMARPTKGHKLAERMMRVVDRGTACIIPMPWETPYIVFEDEIGNKYRWHSDRADWDEAGHLRVGDRVKMNAFAYPPKYGDEDSLRRVQIVEVFPR